MFSPGVQSYLYVISGPVCRLYNLGELPYPCCRIQWRGREPSWNREGRQYVPDLATRRHPSYHAALWVSDGEGGGRFVPKDLTLYWEPPLSTAGQRWWSRNRTPVQHSPHWHRKGKGLLVWDATSRPAIDLAALPLQHSFSVPHSFLPQPPADLFERMSLTPTAALGSPVGSGPQKMTP